MSKKALTEADIVKMPEKDYMNAAQLEFFKAKLLALKVGTFIPLACLPC